MRNCDWMGIYDCRLISSVGIVRLAGNSARLLVTDPTSLLGLLSTPRPNKCLVECMVLVSEKSSIDFVRFDVTVRRTRKNIFSVNSMVSRKTSQRTLAFAASIKSIQAQHLRNSARPFKRQLQPRIVATIVLTSPTPNLMRHSACRSESHRPNRTQNESVRNVTPR